jgi:nicotinate-nucleotide pyrophosphorylase
MFDHYSAIATKTDKMVPQSKPRTRLRVAHHAQSAPDARIYYQGDHHSGAMPHRLGRQRPSWYLTTSEFIGGIDGLIAQLNDIKSRVDEKKSLLKQMQTMPQISPGWSGWDSTRKVPAASLRSGQ